MKRLALLPHCAAPVCSHRKKRMRQIKKMMQRGLLDPEKEDPFSLFVASTTIRYCFYHDTHKILGNTFGMAVLQARPSRQARMQCVLEPQPCCPPPSPYYMLSAADLRYLAQLRPLPCVRQCHGPPGQPPRCACKQRQQGSP